MEEAATLPLAEVASSSFAFLLLGERPPRGGATTLPRGGAEK